MLKDNFELCYKLPDCRNKYIVPLLITNRKPDYDWDNTDNLQFRFQSPFMPKGIVSRLIVRMHTYIRKGQIWDEGAVFQKGNAVAQVIERKTVEEGLKIIEIRLSVTPNNRKEFLTLLREDIKQIQNGSFPNLPYLEMVPCSCEKCKGSDKAEFYKNTELEDFLSTNDYKIQCRSSRKMVDIVKLMGDVGIKVMETNREKGDTIVNVYGTVQGSNLNTGDGNQQTIVPSPTEEPDLEDKIIKKKSLDYQRYALITAGTIAAAVFLTFVFKVLGIL